MKAAVITTFGNHTWEVHAKAMLQSFVENWPATIPLMVQLDNDSLSRDVSSMLRKTDGLNSGVQQDHADFVKRHAGKDDEKDYRKQVVRFCHKVFAIKYALETIRLGVRDNAPDLPRYLIWLDADVVTTKKVSLDDLKACAPAEGDAVSYLGRKDWHHSECGWLMFDLENGGAELIDSLHRMYITDEIMQQEIVTGKPSLS